jgi:MYXO-CTERM domain-containing protein
MRNVLSLALMLVLVAGLGAAQTSPSSDQGSAQQSGDTRDVNRGGNDHNWGWVGLLGLTGLFGLRRRRNEEVNRDLRSADLRRAG